MARSGKVVTATAFVITSVRLTKPRHDRPTAGCCSGFRFERAPKRFGRCVSFGGTVRWTYPRARRLCRECARTSPGAWRSSSPASWHPAPGWDACHAIQSRGLRRRMTRQREARRAWCSSRPPAPGAMSHPRAEHVARRTVGKFGALRES